jgi:phage terminase large subunit-like protein
MGDGLEITAFGQGFLSMAAPVKHLLQQFVGKAELEHGNNPVLTWMASNAVTIEDPAGNLKFDKSKSANKIDGIVALTMATGLAIQTNVGPTESYYDSHELEVG